jgi:outer membrane protein assembly factor BamB
MALLFFRIIGVVLLIGCAAPVAHAADWPMWRYDAQRSAASPQGLPAKLYLQWSRDYPPLQPAWPDQAQMQFDVAYEPVVLGQMLFLNSSRHDCVRALDTRTGQERWTFFADGPVRFAPVAWEGRVYFTSDDGHLYCLDANNGKELWKHRGGPSDRKILGNERLISTWPARGAPVIADGTVYFAASIWPFMGVFVHALDARTGNVVWTNDADGSLYIKQPHNADSFAGVAPQGPMVIAGDRLLVPGGRSVPACLDRKTGKLLRFQLGENGKRGGGSEVCAFGNVFFNGGSVFDLNTEKYLADFSQQLVLTPDVIYTATRGACKAFQPAAPVVEEEEEPQKELGPEKGAVIDKDAEDKEKADKEKREKERKEKTARAKLWNPLELASCKFPGAETIIKAGARLYVGATDQVIALDVDPRTREMTAAWRADVPGRVVRLIAADDRLFVVTREGRVCCFAGQEVVPQFHPWNVLAPPSKVSATERKAAALLKSAPSREGYAVMWGIGDGKLLHELVAQSKLHFIVVEPREDKILKWRTHLTQADLYGTRVCIVPGRPTAVTLPPYLASVMVCEDLGVLGGQPVDEFLGRAFVSLRPFGGTAFFDATPAVNECVPQPAAKLPGARVKAEAGFWALTREGALAGSGNWTHEHADAANTRVSPDQLVKAPLGVLWFGGPSHEGILPRHGHGPQPQVIDGRLIIEGVDLLRAIDIYTGRLLWEAPLPGVGNLYNNLAHQAGANGSGGNFVCTSDCIYVAYQNSCVRLDPATGGKLPEFRLPGSDDAREAPLWGSIQVAGDYLIGGADPLFDAKKVPPPAKGNGDDKDDDKKAKSEGGSLSRVLKSLRSFSDNFTASRQLVVLDRHTGKVLWQVAARHAFRHNATCIGGGRLYTIDRLSGDQMARLRLNDEDVPAPCLRVFDLRTGKELWSSADEVFGTWLSYSVKHDVLVESGRMTRDSLLDEARGMRAYRGETGKVLWHEADYRGPAMIHGETVLQDQGGCDLLTGNLKMREDPITGQLTAWKWTRSYGCNTPSASEHLLTFRSGAAGYFDYCNDGGTGNFGGFRSSCTNNLLVAGGVLTVPEYTRTCTCRYQNQTSVGLVHMPEAEMWTYFGTKELKGPVQRLGITFGAPGDRRAENGTLWLEHPSTGGASPAVSIKTKPANVEFFRHHSSFVEGQYNWVAASGMKGLNEVTVGLGDNAGKPRSFTVRLIFAEPDVVKAGERVFDVALQGKVVLQAFDVAKEAGGARRSLVKEFRGVEAVGSLIVRLTPSAQATLPNPILCGIEIVADKQ